MASQKPSDWNEYVPNSWSGDFNYGYVIVDDANHHMALVDPADVTSCMQIVEEEQSLGNRLVGILTTHWHIDHAGGNGAFLARFPGISVYGRTSPENSALEKLGPHPDMLQYPWHVPEFINQELEDAATFQIGALSVRAILVPAHTDTHVVFLVRGSAAEPPHLFSGDALFVGGCGNWIQRAGLGRLLAAGTAAPSSDKHARENLAVMAKLSGLAPETLVWCAHEYTLKNLHFCLTVDPSNQALKQKVRWCIRRRTTPGPCFGFMPTVPSTIGEELSYNVFLRAKSVEEMLRLREGKDTFKGSGKADDPELVALASAPSDIP